jgi:8-oxo-dGTP pyrophosphatase MutT (NUDIX family)/phosphohistidine phosphatase SixA
MADSGHALVRAAGAVLSRPGRHGVEVLLVHRPRYDDWTFPKGKRAAGEHLLLTAVREVTEETGIRPALGRRLASTSYLAQGRPKRVEYWAARAARDGAADGDTADFVPNAEVDELAWLPLPAARDRLSYDHDWPVLDGFAAGPADTAPLILLRHAVAVSKRDWVHAGPGGDLARPLSAEGKAQADELAQILRCFPAAQVISSAAERCVATVRPYADLTGTAVETAAALTVSNGSPAGDEGHWTATETARQQATQVVRSIRHAQPVLLCGHRQTLPSLLAWACELLGSPPPDGPGLGKGAFWVLHASRDGLAAAEQHQSAEQDEDGG